MSEEYYVMLMHPDHLRDLFWKPPDRRSASARKRKAARYGRKSGIRRKA